MSVVEKMFQFHPSATEKCQKSPLDIDERKQSNKSSNSVKKGSMDQQNQPLTRHGGRVDVELCHIVAFATKADLQVKKLDDKKIQVHFEKVSFLFLCFFFEKNRF